VDFISRELEHLEVPITLNFEPYGVEIRQWITSIVMLPIVGVFSQIHVCAGLVIRDIERTQYGHFFFRRTRRHDGDLIEKPLYTCHRRRKNDRYSVWREHG